MGARSDLGLSPWKGMTLAMKKHLSLQVFIPGQEAQREKICQEYTAFNQQAANIL
jgi:hypothetical protein